MKILFSCTGIPTLVEEGDVIIVKDEFFFHFYYVVQSECKLIEKVKTIKFMQGCIKYGIVFENSNLVPRKGDKEILQFLMNIFKRESTVAFLQNALEILRYNEDKWDVSILQSLLFAEQFTEEKSRKTSFVDFLNNQAKDFFYKQIDNGSPISDAYRSTKATYPIIFTQALKEFKIAYPEKSIYDSENPQNRNTH